jgi:hypothetical protein
MDCINAIQKLSANKLAEAKCFFENGFFDWSFYTAGYTIELLLKARVCKVLGIEDFFDAKSTLMKKFKFPQAFKSHDFEQLLIISGVYKQLQRAARDANFKAKWSTVCSWDEGSRYISGKNKAEVQNFLISIKDIAKWILKYL